MVVDMSKWSDEQARRIGKAVKALRGDRTGQWLADRTAELGHPISRTTISELESDEGRRRHVTTAELAILAAALDVSPVVLLFPGPYDRKTAVLPHVDWTTELDAAQWFSGILPHGFSEATGAEQAEARAKYEQSVRQLTLWRRLWEVEQEQYGITRSFAETEAGIALTRRLNREARDLRMQLGIEDEDGG